MKKNLFGICLVSTALLLAACGGTGDSAKSSDTKEKTEQAQKENKENEEKYVYERNGHKYEVDTVSGATTGEYSGTEYKGDEKQEKMYWSGRPEVGTVKGDYYTDTIDFEDGYIGTADVVVDGDKLVLVEFDERGPDDYYSETWAGQTKRTSGYANFQAENDRTNVTLVTIVNGMTILEDQMMKENSLTGDFVSVKGSSNSVRRGFIPLAEKIDGEIKNGSKLSYQAVTKDLGDGLFARLIVIKDKESGKITEAKYNEFFADTEDEIKNKEEKPFYRQSKYDSITYAKETGIDFKKISDDLTEKIVKDQSLDVSPSDDTIKSHYDSVATDMKDLLK
ncbi:hypothetical protein [Vagococcus martis]|uniref:hypothetical protein n=1 Tax=Vagococcus martis TaxID=1768210 RepID=UPI001E567B62|nr:hypothetical protein [Vagococcus martis]